eukprot:988901-Amphidinium_carterae.1
MLRAMTEGHKVTQYGLSLKIPSLNNNLRIIASALFPMLPHLHLTHTSILGMVKKDATSIANTLSLAAIDAARTSVKPVLAVTVAFHQGMSPKTELAPGDQEALDLYSDLAARAKKCGEDYGS